MSRAVVIVGGGLAGVLAAFEAHRQGASSVTLCEQADVLGGSSRGRIRHGVELRERPILFGPPSDPIAGLLEDYGVPLHAFPDKAAEGPIASLPAGGFPRLFDTCHTRLRAQGVTVETARLVSPREAMAAATDSVVVWASDPTPLFKPLGLGRPALEARTHASYSFCAYWDGALPFRVEGEGALQRAHLYESGGRTVLTAECIGEQDEGPLRAEIEALAGRAGGFLKVAGFLGKSVHTRWSLRPSEAASAMSALDDLIAARCPGRFLLADWASPDAGLFLRFRSNLEAALYEEPLRAAG